jgi:DNA invertase Pin-like site-specific DNA recombinase
MEPVPLLQMPQALPSNFDWFGSPIQFEREAISKRIKEALAAAKAKGKRLGTHQRIAKAKQAPRRPAPRPYGPRSPRRLTSRRRMQRTS